MAELEKRETLEEIIALSFEQWKQSEPGSKEQANITDNTVKLYRMSVEENRSDVDAYLNERKYETDSEIQKQRLLADIQKYRRVSADTVFKVVAGGLFTGVALIYTANGHVWPTQLLRYLPLPKALM